MEVPEDLDVCIAQRHFEEAYNLLERAREFLDKNTATDPVITDIRYTINDLVMFDSCMNLNMLSFLTAWFNLLLMHNVVMFLEVFHISKNRKFDTLYV